MGWARANVGDADVKIFVTGGTGYLGKHVMNRLVQAGHQVRMLARKNSNLNGLPIGQFELFDGDLMFPGSIATGPRRMDAVIHLAACPRLWRGDQTVFEKLNVVTTARLMEAALGAGVSRFIHTSCAEALGYTDNVPAATESFSPPDRHYHNEYERTKSQGLEMAALNYDKGLPVITLMPTVLYGPGDLTQSNRIASLVCEFVASDAATVLDEGNQVSNYAYIEDVADAHLLALEKGFPGESYILGGQNATMAGLLELLAKITRRSLHTRQVKFKRALLKARFEEIRARLTKSNPRTTRDAVEIAKHNWAYDDSKARAELGYNGRAIPEGLTRTVEWLKSLGLIRF